MGKVIRAVASIAVSFIPVVGPALGASLLATTALTLGASALGALLAKKPKVSAAQRDRLYATIDPSAPRKAVFGQTAMASDIRYEEWGGADQEYLDRIIAVASHACQSIDEIWIDDKQAWTSAGGVTGDYSGYLTVATRLEGNAGNTIAINGGAKWGSSRRLTGCAYVHMRFKTTGNSKKATSPFASSIPQRITIIGRGMKLYDPRQDSTAGGSGAMRANDQTTWGWTSDTMGNNAALQILTYLLGWRINGKLAAGRGVPPRRLNMAAFIAAANLCEESVGLAAGGTEARYMAAGVVSENDAPTAVLEVMTASCAGMLRDVSGQIALDILHNDLGAPVAAFTDDDVLGDFTWSPTSSLQESFNLVRGRWTDPSTASLYQLVDYPPVQLSSPDGLERAHTLDLSMVQSASQAQRLAKQELQRAQYPAQFEAEFKATGWRVQVGQVVTLTFSALGFVTKLFRVQRQVLKMDGVVIMTLVEENAAIYAWAAEESPAVVAAAPTVYDPLNAPLIRAVSEAILTFHYPDTVPADPPIGSLYFDAAGRKYRFEGLGLVDDASAAILDDDGNQILTDGWVEVRDIGISAAQDAADAAAEGLALQAARVDRIASDGWLSTTEKPQTAILYQALVENHAALDTKAVALGIAATERASANTKMGALLTHLSSLSPAWNDASQDTVIVPATYKTAWDEAYAAVAALQAAIQGQPGVSPVAITLSPPTATVQLDYNGVPSGLPIGFTVLAHQSGSAISVTSVTKTAESGGSFSVAGAVVTLNSLTGGASDAYVVLTIVAGGQTFTGITLSVGTSKAGLALGTAKVDISVNLSEATASSFAQVGGTLAINASNAGKVKVNLVGPGGAAGHVRPDVEDYQYEWKIELSANGGSTWPFATSVVTSTQTVFNLTGQMRGGLTATGGPYSITGLGSETPCLARLMLRQKAGTPAPSAMISSALTMTAEQEP